MRFDRKKLVAVVFSGGGALNVVEVDDPRLAQERTTVDEKAGTWTRPPSDDLFQKPKPERIGRSHNFIRQYQVGGVLGVFDPTNRQHLDAMVNGVEKAVTLSDRYCED